MAGSFPAASFHPASVDSAARYPSWVLLDRKAYFTDVENATTATATSRTGHVVKVTFRLADPPSLSHLCVHGPTEHLAVEPQVVFSEKDLALLAFTFTSDSLSTVEYFVYKAGAGRGNRPSLRPIPAAPPGPGTKSTKHLSMVVRDDGEFLLADLFPTSTAANYDLDIFSSKTDRWITKTLPVQAPAERLRQEDVFMVPHKAISLGGGMVGWVDLWRAVIVCDILAEDPFIYLFPLPKPEYNLARKGDPKPVRDVTGSSNGVIRFVEMDNNFRAEVVTVNNDPGNRFKMTKDLDTVDKMFDLDMLLLPHETFPEEPIERINYIPDGWKIRTCYRHISWDHWRTGHSVHVDDISVNNTKHCILLPQLLDGSGKSTLGKLASAYPTLSPNGDGVVYVMSKVDNGEKNAWMVGVDLGSKTVETFEPYSTERASNFKLDCLTCAFSEFLSTAPRSCAEEAEFASNEAQNRLLHGHISSGSSGRADREAPGYRHLNSQHQPPSLSASAQPLLLNVPSSALQAAKDKAAETAQAAKEKTDESKDQIRSFLGEKTDESTDQTGSFLSETGSFLGEKTKAAKRKASEMARYTKSAVVGATGAVGNTLVMWARRQRQHRQRCLHGSCHYLEYHQG